MPHPARLASIVGAAAVFAVSVSAQVPYGYVVVSELAILPNAGIHYVEPATGVVTEFRAGSASVAMITGALSVDPIDPTRLYTVPLLSTSIAAYLMWYDVQGTRYNALMRAPIPGAAGAPKRFWSLGTTVLATIPGRSGGLWSVDTASSTATQLAQLADATDVVAIGNLVYVNSYNSGQSSTVVEVDLTTGQSRTVGTSLPTIRSLGSFAGAQLIGGTDSGDLVLIDPATGNTSLLIGTNAGAITALASDPVSGLPYFATSRNEVRFFGSPATAIYTTANFIHDIDVGTHALPSHLQFGDGCVGSTGMLPSFTYVDVPAIGGNYTLEARGGIAGTGALLVAGFSRTAFNTGAPLPIPLSSLVPGAGSQCLILTDAAATALRIVSIAGSASVVLGVPNDPLLSGQHVVWQWLHLDAMAPGGAVVSDAVESIVR